MREQNVKNIYEEVEHFLNTASSSEIVELGKMFADDRHTHRTIQSNFADMMRGYMEKFVAKTEYDVDGRNEHVWRFCQKIKEFVW